MLRRYSLFVLLVPGFCQAQDMVLSSGSLRVSNGTSLRIESPLAWQLDAGAVVINDGLIDLGGVGSMNELPGAPITGDGMERAVWLPTAPLANAEPGNLGLTLTTSFPDGGLVVERGHLPRVADNGTPGIGRWFRISTPVPTASTLAINLEYDPLELGPAQPSALSLFAGSSPTGPWSAVPTAISPQQVLSGNAPSPEVFITAFDSDLVTNASVASNGAAWSVSPTLVDDRVWIESLNGGPVKYLILSDAHGRIVQVENEPNEQRTALNMRHLPAGLYLLRINGEEGAFKLLKR
ncbi:MAG: T9SS type A sorting domain-containing protein [Flavobacteriales bacterium]|nr:T9SS type A sorting domain-containing protein [Flavobacteriales bacterium]